MEKTRSSFPPSRVNLNEPRCDKKLTPLSARELTALAHALIVSSNTSNVSGVSKTRGRGLFFLMNMVKG